MDARPRRLVGASIPLTLLTSVMAISAPALATSTPQTAPAERAEARVELPSPLRGEQALQALGSQLDEAAESNDLRPQALAGLLREDRTAWLDESGRLYYQEPAAGVTSRDASTSAEASAPLSETFRLHSKPGSAHTIFLDFDGATVSGTAWHAAVAATPTTHPVWDPARNGASFSDDERTRVQAIWAAVAEDYAAFDVDVTTQDPGPDAIRRTSTTDLTYGAHALITPTTADDVLCNGSCGGLAYVGTVGKVDTNGGGNGYGYRAPAWVFPQNLGNGTKSIAEAISHEVGHNLGLSHDGGTGTSYYYGHAMWAPIMGVGYNRPVTQWSAGTYAGATQRQDDVTIIANSLGQRADEAPAGIAGASAPTPDLAYLSHRSDVDTYHLARCSGAVTIQARPAEFGPSADLSLTLLDATGSPVAMADPLSAMVNSSLASGLDASISRTLAAGTYYVSVDGTGRGTWLDGYDDYGTLGSYTLKVTGCEDSVAPPQPTSTTTTLTSELVGSTATLTGVVGSPTGSPSGTLRLLENGNQIGTAIPLVEGRATLVRSSLPEGTHRWTAAFVPGDATLWDGSTSSEVTGTVLPTSPPPPSDPPPTVTAVSTTTTLSAAARDRRVTLDSRVSGADGSTPSGTVEVFDGTTRVASVVLTAGRATATLRKVGDGVHPYVAVFTPSSTSHAASTSTIAEVRIGRVASSTTVQIPAVTNKGSRPVVRVSVVRDDEPVSGKIVLRHGRRTSVLRLRDGRASMRLQKVRASRLRVVARYPGDRLTQASRARVVLRTRR